MTSVEELGRLEQESSKLKEAKYEVLNQEQEDWYNQKYPNDPNNQKTEQKESKKLLDQAVEFLMESFTFVTVSETDELLYYGNGVYERGAEVIIKQYTQKLLETKTSISLINEIIATIKRMTYHKREEFDSNLNIINLKNGLYDIERNVLCPHTPDYLSLNQKPIKYDKNARPNLFGKFIRDVLYPHEIRTGLEAMAYTFHRDYELEFIFILFGLGANGKSVYTSVMTALHGRRNVSNVTIKQMCGENHFALSDLENKDVNIDSEAVSYISNTATLKRLTGGSKQPVRIERKRQDAYDTILYAKLFLNANDLPKIESLTNADSRRFVIITFPNEFDGKKADIQLVKKLTTEAELSGIFNVLMTYLREVLRKEQIHINEKTMEERRQKYERTANPIKAFIKERVFEAEGHYMTKPELHHAYLDYCSHYKLPSISMDKFGKDLKKLRYPEDLDFEIKSIQKKVNGENERVWLGIQLIPEPEKQTVIPLLGDLR